MRRQVWAFWALISAFCLLGLLVWSIWHGPARALPSVLVLQDAELNFTPTTSIPASGWISAKLPANALSTRALPGEDGVINAWARMSFNGSQFGNRALAIYTENNRERLVLFLNGMEVFRNSPDDNAHVLGWNHPYLAPLPNVLVNDARNEIVVRVSSRADLNMSIGQVEIGPHDILAKRYHLQNMLRISGPLAANFTMLFLTAAVLILWLVRRSEETLLWIAMTGVFWFIRNYHFFTYQAPIDPKIFGEITYYSIYFAIAASLSFCVDFLKLPNRKLIIKLMFGLCFLFSIWRFIAVQFQVQDAFVNLAALLIVVGVTWLMIKDWIRNPTPDHALLVTAVVSIVILSVHDIGRSANLNWWDGMGFHAQPLIGLLLFAVFLVSIGRRFVDALNDVERANQTLEARVATARRDLAQSELARRELEVLNAIESERERLMREMHDGIGSNLITALAIAKQADESPRTIQTLRRAISDLKITVDSLAPVQGDLVALLANFRHRLEPDLREAGLKCVWKVEPCPSLPWLDSVNALQMLRIIQEAVSNVLVHSNASSIEIGAKPATFDGEDGIETWISDNGVGFDLKIVSRGRGISNMKARAQSLAGQFLRESKLKEGTKIVLWLPLSQGRPGT